MTLTFGQATESRLMRAIIAALLAPMAAIAVEKDAEKVLALVTEARGPDALCFLVCLSLVRQLV